MVRVTNMMLTNTMLLNINRNVGQIDKLYTQISTAKKIQVPSDDPITAARALKFRSNVSETEQYQQNVSQGMAWMDVTEGAYNNVVDIMKTIKDRCVEAANGILETTDRQAIAAQIRQMTRQLGSEMNVTYAGRYVFSGFRTNEPPVFSQAVDDKRYEITQSFTVNDIEKTQSYQKLSVSSPSGTDEPLVYHSNMMKLSYSYATSLTPTDSSFEVITASALDPNPYDSASIPSGKLVYIQETGELIVSDADIADFPSQLDIKYVKAGFADGELNPIVYFPCKDLDSALPYDMSVQDIAYEFSVNTDVYINSLAKNVYTDKMFADLNRLCRFLEEISISNERRLSEKYSSDPYNLTGDQLNAAVNRQITAEKGQLAAVLHDRFNNMLEMCDRYIANISKEQTDLGARMNRLDLIQSRLEQDEGGYTKLMSDNEDVDMMEAMMRKSNAEAVYQASLKAGASIIQMTLSNFI
ncbi:MAG: flagellar hook-associated protein FlgL [Clostridiales bacterium]|jgi:flagellar hook-associated protein 3 FlgL|nr:flagellar hook-associated protein FlgL [Clostridiales bacterium]